MGTDKNIKLHIVTDIKVEHDPNHKRIFTKTNIEMADEEVAVITW